MIRRSLFALSLLLLAAPLFAQSSDIGLWLSYPQFDSTEFTDPEDPAAPPVELSFDENIGYGVTFTHSFGGPLAIELGAQRLGGDASLSSGPVDVEFGEIDINAYSAALQWRFAPRGRLVPYVGGGVAYVTGDFEFDAVDGEPPDEVELENETTWLANAGVTFNISDRLGIGADLRYIAYDPTEKGGDEADSIDVNPLVFSVGVRLRFGR